uniref:Uncharacterized protein n=1 Tax=Leviviridae sp. TaxID=2027243 RepID=A0A514CZ90_9VIRU|nr:MAG: hypothetical protein H3Rhizo37244_000003 [Leviviridae sp.]QDH90438.1 MAG: hypothetical protein H3Bulk421065_000003 [Leviviridae sp.]
MGKAELMADSVHHNGPISQEIGLHVVGIAGVWTALGCILWQFVTLSVGDLWAAIKGKYPLADDLWGWGDT